MKKKAKATDKGKAHVPLRRIKWKGAVVPVYIDPEETDKDGRLLTVTMSHIEDSAYLGIIKRRIARLATEKELENAVVLGD